MQNEMLSSKERVFANLGNTNKKKIMKHTKKTDTLRAKQQTNKQTYKSFLQRIYLILFCWQEANLEAETLTLRGNP